MGNRMGAEARAGARNCGYARCLINRDPVAHQPKGLMKILGASFAKFPILETFSVYSAIQNLISSLCAL